MGEPASRAASTGTAAEPQAPTMPSSNCSAAGPSTCLRCSSPASATGEFFQVPGSVERMQNNACTQMLGCHLIDGAGHWVQQEQPEQVSELLLQFLTQQDRQAASERKR